MLTTRSSLGGRVCSDVDGRRRLTFSGIWHRQRRPGSYLRWRPSLGVPWADYTALRGASRLRPAGHASFRFRSFLFRKDPGGVP